MRTFSLAILVVLVLTLWVEAQPAYVNVQTPRQMVDLLERIVLQPAVYGVYFDQAQATVQQWRRHDSSTVVSSLELSAREVRLYLNDWQRGRATPRQAAKALEFLQDIRSALR